MTTPSQSNASFTCRVLGERILEPQTPLHVVHHWDTDGMASAALVIRARRGKNHEPETRATTPRIGSFSPQAVVEALGDTVEKRGFRLLVLDYGISWPPQPLEGLGGEELHVVDHHRTGYPKWLKWWCNPAAVITKGGEEESPSTTWVLYRHVLGDPRDPQVRALVALGLLGDLGHRALRGVLRGVLEGLLRPSRLSPEEAYRLSQLLDSCYKTLDRACVEEYTLRLAWGDLGELLGDEGLQRRAASLERTVKEAVKGEPEILLNCVRGRVGVWVRESNAYITSSVGRALASERGLDVIVLVDRVPPLGRAYVYTRSPHLPVGAWLVGVLRSLAPSAGGKDSVAVAECPLARGCVERVLDAVLRVLEDRLGGCNHA